MLLRGSLHRASSRKGGRGSGFSVRADAGARSVLGRAVVIMQGKNGGTTQPTGDAGPARGAAGS